MPLLEGDYGLSECYDCGLILRKNHLKKKYIVEDVGGMSGERTGSLSYPATWQGFQEGTDDRRGRWSNSNGRMFYHRKYVWLCVTCRKKRFVKTFLTVTLAIFIFIFLPLWAFWLFFIP